MKTLEKVFWKWSKGKTTYNFTFSSGKTKSLYLSECPPTKPSHDISHFICGFHDDLDWDFTENPNYIAEYNAVFLENLLHNLASHLDNRAISLKSGTQQTIKYMEDFANNYYKIPQNLGEKFNHINLQNNFISKIDPNIVQKYWFDFYSTWYIDSKLNMPSKNIDIELEMISNIKRNFNSESYDYICEIKKMGN